MKSRYYRISKNRYGIKVGKYDKNYPLIIDPVSLVYSTYLGGSDADWGYAIAVDNQGYAYVTGWTTSSDFPTQNPFQGSYQGNRDAFVTKLSQDGTSLVYSTYLGGSNVEYGRSIAVDSRGHAYVAGWTGSTDFPTQNPFQDSYQGGTYDVFVTKLRTSEADLSITKTVNNRNPEVGENITYTITITNNGPDDADNITVEDNLPSGLLYESSNPSQGSYNYYTGVWDVGTLQNGHTARLTITADVDEGGRITNIATITNSNLPDPDTTNNRAILAITAGYRVDARVEGGHGRVFPSTQTVPPGGAAIIKITPAPGYEIKKITDNGVSKPITNPYRITNVRENHIVVVRFARKIKLSLAGERKTEKAWIIRKDYGKLYMTVKGSLNDVSRFVIQRSVNGGAYEEIKSIDPSEFQSGGSYIYYDKYLEKGKTYKYKFIAFDNKGAKIAESNEIEL